MYDNWCKVDSLLTAAWGEMRMEEPWEWDVQNGLDYGLECFVRLMGTRWTGL